MDKAGVKRIVAIGGIGVLQANEEEPNTGDGYTRFFVCIVCGK